MAKINEIEYFLQGQKTRSPVVLAKLLSLIESKNSKHQKLVHSILKKIKKSHAYVLGVSGTPGAGKSTLINMLGQSYLQKNDRTRLAVIAVDPSSDITGGSILGDKTRMKELAAMPTAFIRPVASKGSLGGITPKLDLMIEALQGWGFEFIVIETVGVGQSESAVRAVVDDLLLVIPPGTGDDLQAMKRGILELVDAVCVNKVDQFNHELVEHSLKHYASTLNILQQRPVSVFATSSMNQAGVEKVLTWLMQQMKQRKLKSAQAKAAKARMAQVELMHNFSLWYKKKKKSEDNMTTLLKSFGKYLASK